ncbi:hypothetical protein DFQ27_004379 [Actinomortierella ambigua]|uniref:DUF803-domain-containing protein n=1 Tax=Actinomortierella ambigua TaxID=1343610 RepID=A0A9P6Q3W2_9FUNG|nr:hypothetical protein DFQ27_004379 [Actinomortierella ambigua]
MATPGEVPNLDTVGATGAPMHDKYVGLLLAVSSSLMIGISFVITKKGLIDSTSRHAGHGSASEQYLFLKNPIWLLGMLTMAAGEIANFAAYSFAPAILVTPLGALSVIIGLGIVGKVGCALCLIGSVVIVMHAPEDKDITSVDEILNYAMQPGFVIYSLFVLGFSTFMIYRVVPKWGNKSPLVNISICSLVGSITVMASKGFGIALKLTFAGSNQLTHPSTYVFALLVGVCIVVQMNYFNKALDIFSTNIVMPIYYVMFTTATITASVILFQGFNTTSMVDVVSLFCGFGTIFSGVLLLNNAQQHAATEVHGKAGAINSIASGGAHHHHGGYSDPHLRRSSRESTLLNAFDEESLGLTQLREEEDDDDNDSDMTEDEDRRVRMMNGGAQHTHPHHH